MLFAPEFRRLMDAFARTLTEEDIDDIIPKDGFYTALSRYARGDRFIVATQHLVTGPWCDQWAEESPEQAEVTKRFETMQRDGVTSREPYEITIRRIEAEEPEVYERYSACCRKRDDFFVEKMHDFLTERGRDIPEEITRYLEGRGGRPANKEL